MVAVGRAAAGAATAPLAAGGLRSEAVRPPGAAPRATGGEEHRGHGASPEGGRQGNCLWCLLPDVSVQMCLKGPVCEI